MGKDLDEVQLLFMSEKERKTYERQLQVQKEREEFADTLEKFRKAVKGERKTKLKPIPYVEFKEFEPYTKVTANAVNIDKTEVGKIPEKSFTANEIKVTVEAPFVSREIPGRSMDGVNGKPGELPTVVINAQIVSKDRTIDTDIKISLPDKIKSAELPIHDFSIERQEASLPQIEIKAYEGTAYEMPKTTKPVLPKIEAKMQTITEKPIINPKYEIKESGVNIAPVNKNVHFEKHKVEALPNTSFSAYEVKNINIEKPDCVIEPPAINFASVRTEISFEKVCKPELPTVNVDKPQLLTISISPVKASESIEAFVPKLPKLSYEKKEHKAENMPKISIASAPAFDIGEVLNKI